MKRILLVLVFLIAFISCETQTSKEKGKIFRSPTRNEFSKMENEVNNLLAKHKIDQSNIHNYNLGKNCIVFVYTESSEAESFGDGCSVNLIIYYLINNNWTLKDKFVSLGQVGQYGNCNLSNNDLNFYTAGEKIVGSLLTGQSHGGSSNEEITLFTIEEGKIYFSGNAITVEENNIGSGDQTTTDWKSDYYFQANDDEIHFINKKSGVKENRKFSEEEDFILADRKFIKKNKDTK